MLINYNPDETYISCVKNTKKADTQCTECKKFIKGKAPHYAIVPNVIMRSGKLADVYFPFCEDCVKSE